MLLDNIASEIFQINNRFSLSDCKDDYCGRIGDRIFRVVVNPQMKVCYDEMFKDQVLMNELFSVGLIDTKLLGLDSSGAMILEHEPFKFQTFYYEWTFNQRQDAAVMVLSLQKELDKIGRFLIDPNTMNATFNRVKPVYFDFCSIRPGNCPRETWLRSFYFGGNTIQAWRDKLNISFGELQDLLTLSKHNSYDAQIYWVLSHQNPFVCQTQWTDYDKKTFNFDDSSAWQGKHLSVKTLFTELDEMPQTATDLGSNTGDYSKMLLRFGVKNVCSIDIDEKSLSILHEEAKSKNLPITVVVSDFIHTYNHFCGGTRVTHTMNHPLMDRYKAQRRFAADLVLAVSLVHHLCYWRNVGFGELAQVLSEYAKKYLIIEWIPFTDKCLEGPINKYGDNKHHYTEGNFVSVMKQFFKGSHAVCGSSPEGRVMYLFRK